MILTGVAERRALLARSTTIAMVGASGDPLRPSYTVFSYLRTESAFTVTPINPKLDEIDGIRAFASLADYARTHGAPDIVDVFRNPASLLPIVDESIAVGAKAIWFQYGVVNEAAIARADAAGLEVVVDRCIKVEIARFTGGLATAGLNSGIISSRRTGTR